MAITTIDRDACRVLGADVAAALKAVADKHGLVFTYKGGTFDPSGIFRPSVEFAVADAAKAAWNRYCGLCDLPADAVGATVALRDGVYQILRLNPGAPKFPVVARKLADGREYKLRADPVAAALAKKEGR
jgi:hypothetical protein